MQTIQVLRCGDVLVKVKYDAYVREYAVFLKIREVIQPRATYYTNEKKDALGTAVDMLKRSAKNLKDIENKEKNLLNVTSN